ncbi:response regulator [Archangium sp.]|jgi:CheY-like chemotaxis protein|uniref:response regulator n=1 Tax=Archangium sp. TaxID=1872627 RepID=UPI002EDBA3F0
MIDSPPFILLVEDESDLRTVIEEALVDEGCAVVSAKDGSMALEWLSGTQRPALVLLDFIMPRVNGWTFLERMRADPAFNDIPVVAISALPVTSPLVTAELRKPFELSSLVETVRQFARPA